MDRFVDRASLRSAVSIVGHEDTEVTAGTAEKTWD
jgi:hypothetical protein